MQLDIRIALLKRRPLAVGFLDPVLAEHPMARRQRGLDALGPVHLGDRDEGDFAGLAPGAARRGVDARADSGEVGGDIERGAGLRLGYGHVSVPCDD